MANHLHQNYHLFIEVKLRMALALFMLTLLSYVIKKGKRVTLAIKAIRRAIAPTSDHNFLLRKEKLESQLEIDVLLEIGELQALLAQTKRILNTEFV